MRQQGKPICYSVAVLLGSVEAECNAALICRDPSDLVDCPEDFRRLFDAVSTNYPTSAFFQSAYAADAFQLLLQLQHIGPTEAAHMHCSFPLMHAIIQKRQWDNIPLNWVSFLKTLATKACAAERTVPVSCASELTSMPTLHV